MIEQKALGVTTAVGRGSHLQQRPPNERAAAPSLREGAGPAPLPARAPVSGWLSSKSVWVFAADAPSPLLVGVGPPERADEKGPLPRAAALSMGRQLICVRGSLPARSHLVVFTLGSHLLFLFSLS